ncbi:A-agglutinin anchorage subunit-like [Folsomia candida]|uniref:GlcNAc-binding protein A n=1 Tax=Folsomia candida TaxID=158441 RepID=A0A226CYU4_FOLCA|nr:A-agglutinin anchorage subunit-like [Folsomia candida]OXA38133.1 GlcNAc-binding protein A [Folsomia candida]
MQSFAYRGKLGILISILLVITLTGTHSQDHDNELVLDVEEHAVHPWGASIATHEFYFFYHANVSREALPDNTILYLEAFGVRERLTATNASGVWAAFHERHSSDKCHFTTTTAETPSTTVETPSTAVETSITTATEALTDVTDIPTTVTTEEPCVTKDFPFISFTTNTNEALSLESFSMIYFVQTIPRILRPMILFNVTTSSVSDEHQSYVIPEVCDSTTIIQNFWMECVIYLNKFSLPEDATITKIAVQFQSIEEGDIILVDKLTMKTKGHLQTSPTTTTTTTTTTTPSPDTTSSDSSSSSNSSSTPLVSTPFSESTSTWTPSTTDYTHGSGSWARANPSFISMLIICTVIAIQLTQELTVEA